MRCPSYLVRCKNAAGGEHRIHLPLPKDLTLGTYKPSREGEIDLVCPECRQLHRYAGTEVQHTFEEVGDVRHLPPDPVPMRIELACAHPGCGQRAVIYAVRSPEEDPGVARARVSQSAVFVDCAAGHPLVLPEAARWKVTEGPNCNPF
jgi:hypothetical protein